MVPDFFKDDFNRAVWLTGSRMYGLNKPDSDFDYVGIYFDKDEYLNPFKDRYVTKTSNENSHTKHSAAKFAKLLVKGNPNVAELVFHEPVEASFIAKKMIRMVKPYVVTDHLAASYMGYINEQVRRGFKPSTPQNPERKAQLEEIGYDAKYIMHVLRLAWTLQKILLTRSYQPLTDEQREFLMTVREGTYAKDEIMGMVNDQITALELEYNQCKPGLQTSEMLKMQLEKFFLDVWL